MTFADTLHSIKRFARPLKPYLHWLGAKSYSQYGEDVILFKAMMPDRHGFYVDVGAYDPIEGSNTYKLYKRGWSGLTIEPNPKASWKFKLMRGRDTHLPVGVSPAPSTLQYHQFEIAMLNTMDGERAKALSDEGYVTRGVRDVRCDRLDTLLEENAQGRQIDLLNIDCEGDDIGVLNTIDFVKWRPTVVMLEDLGGFYGMGRSGDASAVVKLMRERGYEPIARLIFTVVFVARDWRELNRRSGAYKEAAIYPNLLPEPQLSLVAGDA